MLPFFESVVVNLLRMQPYTKHRGCKFLLSVLDRPKWYQCTPLKETTNRDPPLSYGHPASNNYPNQKPNVLSLNDNERMVYLDSSRPQLLKDRITLSSGYRTWKNAFRVWINFIRWTKLSALWTPRTGAATTSLLVPELWKQLSRHRSTCSTNLLVW